MALKVLRGLIDKQDNFTIVRDQIVAILKAETENQKNLAIAYSKNPLDWDLRVFKERSNAWDVFPKDLNQLKNKPEKKVPVINVWFETSTVDEKNSNVVSQQKHRAQINIDCYGCGTSATFGTGHIAGDLDAAKESERAFTLVRNILMSSINTTLQLDGVVTKRIPQSVTSFQPEISDDNARQILGTRLVLSVDLIEESPQYVGVPIEELNILVKRAEDGSDLVETDIQY